MSQQLSLFDSLRALPIRVPVDRDGPVVQGRPHEVLELADERPKWRGCPRAEIQLHPEPEGWMWATSVSLDGCGGGYKVGRKWGRFAASREDALHYAAKEIAAYLEGKAEAQTQVGRRVKAWVAQWL